MSTYIYADMHARIHTYAHEYITIYSRPSVFRTILDRGGPDYLRIRSREEQHRGIRNMQK